MLTLYDFGMEIAKIREAADSIEIKGTANAARIVLIAETCNELIQAINDASEYVTNNPPVSQNEEDTLNAELETDKNVVEEEGEVNVKPNPGTTS